ncbi:hypothetical protein AB0H42_05230 [Nocardia sp. NPDC050799]|uniref:hypothetical protein n=1 Tax=Nocardia sp. NPDC050799 TaxID=3154842 RepID=UPI003401244C
MTLGPCVHAVHLRRRTRRSVRLHSSRKIGLHSRNQAAATCSSSTPFFSTSATNIVGPGGREARVTVDVADAERVDLAVRFREVQGIDQYLGTDRRGPQEENVAPRVVTQAFEVESGSIARFG